MFTLAAMVTLTAMGGEERLRWDIHPIEHLNLPGYLHTVAHAIAPDGAITGRDGSTNSSIGWHAFVWTASGGTVPCVDDQWILSEGDAINSSHVVAGSVSTCPQNGACSAAATILNTSSSPQLLSPLIPEFLMIQTITETGHILFAQGIIGSFNINGFVSLPGGSVLPLPLPDSAWSITLAGMTEPEPTSGMVTIAGSAWATPHRTPMIWRLAPDETVMSLELPDADEGGMVEAILADGIILGSIRIDGVDTPCSWSPIAYDYTLLTDSVEEIGYSSAKIGTIDGARAGQFMLGSERAIWHIGATGELTIVDAASLGLPASDLKPTSYLPDGSLLIEALDLQIYSSTIGTWRLDTGFSLLTDRAFGAAVFETAGPSTAIAGADDGTLALNRYPNAWAALAIMPGDVDGSGAVTIDDLLAILSLWGLCETPCLERLDASGDLGVDDLLIVLSHL